MSGIIFIYFFTSLLHIKFFCFLKIWIEFGRIKLLQGYHPNDIEKEWGKLIIAMLEREKALRPEVERWARDGFCQGYRGRGGGAGGRGSVCSWEELELWSQADKTPTFAFSISWAL